MKIYTKEWHRLSDLIGITDMFEPVIDKEYTDEEIEILHQDMLDKYIQEEQSLYDEPPFFDPEEWKAEYPEDEFDPEDYLIAELDEDGDEIDLRNPESYEELLEYQKKEYTRELAEYAMRDPFNEEEATEEFEESYRDDLEEPDPDIPEWVRESVDPRLIALGVLPESVYKKLMAEEEAAEAEFEKLDSEADRLIEEKEKAEEDYPDDYEYLVELLDDIELEYISSAELTADGYMLEFTAWDDDGEDQIKRRVLFSDAEMLENEEPDIEVGTDEDGDVESDCSLLSYELYYEDGRYEAHLLLDNEEKGLKYVTMLCSGIEEI